MVPNFMRGFCCHRFIILIVAAFMSGGSLKAQDVGHQPLRIGFIAPLSGPVAPFGIAAKNGLEMAVNEAPANLLQIQYEDSQFSPTKALVALNKLLQIDKIDLALSLGSPPSSSLVPVAKERGVPLLLWVSDSRLSKGFPNVVRFNTSSAEQGLAAAREAVRRGYRHIAIFLSENDYSESFGQTLQSALPGERVGSMMRVPPDIMDFRSLIAQVHAKAVDAIALCLNAGQVGAFAKQAAEQKMHNAVFGCETLYNSSEIRNAGGALEGAWFMTGYISPDFVRRYQGLYKDDTPIIPAARYYELGRQLAAFAISGEKKAALIPWLTGRSVKGSAVGDYRIIEKLGECFFQGDLMAIEIRDGGFRAGTM